MKNDDFPAFFRAADELSARSQSHFLFALGCNLSLLVLAAVVSLINCPHWVSAAVQTGLLLMTLATTVYLAKWRPERDWYSARAAAESIKTMTWRYVSKAEPFLGADEECKSEFCERLNSVITQNKGVSEKLEIDPKASQVTPLMHQLRLASAQERLEYYVKFRINDQLEWYVRNARSNRLKSRRIYRVLIAVNAIAVLLASVKIGMPDFQYFPIDVLIAVAGGMLAWIQAKRYSELAASYALTANEISILRDQAPGAANDVSLSEYIGDAENAFSREHTQWVARKDN